MEDPEFEGLGIYERELSPTELLMFAPVVEVFGVTFTSAQ